jgi:hypothetical protein
MGYPLNDLGKALTTQIYHTVLGGDDAVPPPKNTFFTWCTPGLPFSAEDLDFCAKGIFSAPTAEEMNTRLNHAFALGALLDFIPDVGAPYSNDRQEGMYKPDAEKRLSEMYRQILRFSTTVSHDLTEEEQAKLEKFRGKLFVTKKVKDLVSDEEKEVIEESPLLHAYNEKMAAYIGAATEYNAKRAAAAGATGPEGKAAVADWAMNAQMYALKVKAAADAWTAAGYRNEIDEINAFINQTTERSLKLWKQSLEEAYEKGVISSPEVPLPFHYTTLVPGNIANAGGWTGLGVSHEHKVETLDEETTSWKAGGGVNFGLFSVGGSAGGTKTEVDAGEQVESFKLTFEMAQAVIVRPWFYPEWFANRGWTMGPDWTFGADPSDGANPPNGTFIGYPTQAIFVRNVTIESAEFVKKYHDVKSKVDADASIGWGPFRLSGGYGHDEHHSKTETTADGTTLTVGGMQIIGFVNHLLGKAPNPLEEFKPEDFS